MKANHTNAFADKGVHRRDIYWAPPGAFTIVTDPDHYLFDPSSPTEAPEDMVQSVDELGVISPIRVRVEGDKMLVSKGRTRVLASLKANERRKKRKAEPLEEPYLLDLGEDKVIVEGMAVENNHRRGSGPLDKIALAARFAAFGYPDDRRAYLLGLDLKGLRCIDALGLCDPAVKRAVADGRLDWRLAPTFAELSREDQRKKLDELATAGVKGPRAAARVVKGQPAAERPRAPSKKVLVRVEEAVEGAAKTQGGLAKAQVAQAFIAGLRFARGEEVQHARLLFSAEVWCAVEQAAAKRKPGRKAPEEEA